MPAHALLRKTVDHSIVSGCFALEPPVGQMTARMTAAVAGRAVFWSVSFETCIFFIYTLVIFFDGLWMFTTLDCSDFIEHIKNGSTG